MAVKRHRTHYDVTAQNHTDAAMNGVERNLGKVNGAAVALGRTFRTLLGATAAIALTREIGRAAIEAERSSNRLTAVLRATGGVAGVTREEIEALSQSMASSTMFDDEAIRNSAAQLSKFGNIHGQVFRDAMKITADLASLMDVDLASAASNVGRALSAPIQGLENLQTYIGRVTDAEMDHIKTLAAEGRAVEAQNEVLRILQQRIGGTAEVMNTGLTKATNDLGKAWDDALEAIGRAPAVTSTATTAFETLTGQLRALKRVVEEGNWVELLFGSYVADLFKRDGGRNVVTGKIRNMGLEDAAALESALSATPAVPIELYGKIQDPNKARREAELKAAAQLREQLDVQAAFRAQQAQEQEDKFLAGLDAQLEKKVELNRIDDDTLRAAEQLAQRYQMAADQEARFADPSRLEEQLEALKKVDQAAMDLGFTFASAFEDAVLEGAKLRDVVQGLGKDIARIVLRRAVTEPIAAAISAGVSGMFGGARAEGGPVSAGRGYLVGEDGPEFFMPNSSGQIVPNGGGGVTIVQHIAVAAQTPIAIREQVFALMPAISANARRGVFEARARGAG